MTGTSSRGAVAFAAVLFTCVGAQASPNEIAVDTAGTSGLVPLVYGAHTLNAALSTGADSDSYVFSGNAGDQMRVVASSSTIGVDVKIELRGPGGILLATSACNGHPGIPATPALCAANLDLQLPSDGTYALNISDLGSNNSGSYSLHLDQNPAGDNWVGFGYGATQSYAIGHLGDSDYFAFNVAAGSSFKLTVAGLTAGLDTHVSVWDSFGTQVRNTECNGHPGIPPTPSTCSVVLDMSATADGVYKFGVWDFGWNDTGNYQVSLACTFPTCATGVPSIPAIPEPPPGLLMLLGVLAVAAPYRFTRRTA